MPLSTTSGQIAFPAILTLALSTGVVTALLNQGIAWWREARHDRASRKRDARYLAIRLAVMLEAFAIKCADQIADNEMYRDHDGYAGKSWEKLPDLPNYPDEDDWRALAPDLLSRVLTLRNELSLADSAIGFWSEVDRECISKECDQQCGKSGYAAWTLARDMRRRYGLDTFQLGETQWVMDILKRLNEKATITKRDQ